MLNLSLCGSPPTLSNTGIGQSQDDSIVDTKQCRRSVAIMPIMGTLSSSSPDLLEPATSALSFSNSTGEPFQFLFTLKLNASECEIKLILNINKDI